MVLELRMGDVVRLKKAHPCGGFEWEVVRLGASPLAQHGVGGNPVKLAGSTATRASSRCGPSRAPSTPRTSWPPGVLFPTAAGPEAPS